MLKTNQDKSLKKKRVCQLVAALPSQQKKKTLPQFVSPACVGTEPTASFASKASAARS